MYKKFACFEKYSVAPCPSRDYYGLKVFNDEVILHRWKITHGPHSLPAIRVIKFSDFGKDKLSRDEIQHVFGSSILEYIDFIVSKGPNTLVTLPKNIVEKLIKYLNLKDISKLLCTSKICNEIFNTNSVWEIFYKRLKGSSKLSDMEKDIGTNQGFKKLAKDHHIRNVVRHNLKLMENKSSRFQKAPGKSEKILRSASINIPKTASKNDEKNTKKHNVSIGKVSNKSLKSPKLAAANKEKKFNLPKKSTSEQKSSIPIDNQSINEKHAAGEGLQNWASNKETTMNNKKEIKEELGKFKFVNDDNEETELLMQKKYLQSIIMQSEISDDDSEELTKLKNSMIKSPRSIFTKSSKYAIEEIKSKSGEKIVDQKKTKSTKSKAAKVSKLKHLISQEKSDDFDENGMSYLMKRYLQASDEVARKFSECERITHSTKNSGIQVNINETSERKPIKKMQKHLTPTVRPISDHSETITNTFAKLRSSKKN